MDGAEGRSSVAHRGLRDRQLVNDGSRTQRTASPAALTPRRPLSSGGHPCPPKCGIAFLPHSFPHRKCPHPAPTLYQRPRLPFANLSRLLAFGWLRSRRFTLPRWTSRVQIPSPARRNKGRRERPFVVSGVGSTSPTLAPTLERVLARPHPAPGLLSPNAVSTVLKR
jgi:hypothetical protein